VNDLDRHEFAQAFHTPWSKPPFNFEPQARKFMPGDAADPSVKQRWDQSPDYKKLWPQGFR
jgi:hypothetical protein